MEGFLQMNVFAWLYTVFAHLIIGCVIWYPKTGNLRYVQRLDINNVTECVNPCFELWEVDTTKYIAS